MAQTPHRSAATANRGAFPARGHDHGICVEDALAVAAEQCRRRGVRLTVLRRRVLELVWLRHAPVGAYAVLEHLHRDGRRAAPPTVYRALDFLVAHGLVHRVESLNAYVGCADPGRPHAGQFLICEGCGTAAELVGSRVTAAIAAACDDAGFVARHVTLEVLGTCPACRRVRGGEGSGV